MRGKGNSSKPAEACKLVKDYVHCRVRPKQHFDPESFRTVSPKEGVQITVGCPKGHYSASSRRCQIRTQTQRIMYRQDVCPSEAGCKVPG